MTQDPKSGPQSMRFGIGEVLSGMLASIQRDSFTDDEHKLGEVFKGLSQQGPLFAPFAAVAEESDFSAVLTGALEGLVRSGKLQHDPGRYRLTDEGRAQFASSKRMLFKASDIADLEAGARYFEEHAGALEKG